MGFNITKEGDYFIVSSSRSLLYPNLELGRKNIVASFKDNGAEFERQKWVEEKFSCKEIVGYWNHLEFRQLGTYQGRKIGLFGSTYGLQETFCSPRDMGDIIINEASIRQGVYRGENPYFIQGRKAVKTDKGSITIAFLLPQKVSQNARLEELFEKGIKHSDEIRAFLSA